MMQVTLQNGAATPTATVNPGEQGFDLFAMMLGKLSATPELVEAASPIPADIPPEGANSGRPAQQSPLQSTPIHPLPDQKIALPRSNADAPAQLLGKDAILSIGDPVAQNAENIPIDVIENDPGHDRTISNDKNSTTELARNPNLRQQPFDARGDQISSPDSQIVKLATEQNAIDLDTQSSRTQSELGIQDTPEEQPVKQLDEALQSGAHYLESLVSPGATQNLTSPQSLDARENTIARDQQQIQVEAETNPIELARDALGFVALPMQANRLAQDLRRESTTERTVAINNAVGEPANLIKSDASNANTAQTQLESANYDLPASSDDSQMRGKGEPFKIALNPIASTPIDVSIPSTNTIAANHTLNTMSAASRAMMSFSSEQFDTYGDDQWIDAGMALKADASTVKAERSYNAMANSASAPLAPALTMQIAQAIDGSQSRFEIQLAPEELGSVEISFEFDGEKRAQLTILVERSETLDLLMRDQRQLERMLGSQGLQLDGGIQMGLRQDNHNGHPNQGFGDPNTPHFSETANEAPDMQDTTKLEPIRSLLSGNGLFDVVI